MRNTLKLLIILGFLFRIATYTQSLPEGEIVEIHGRVSREVTTYTYYQKIIVNNYEIYVSRFPEITYGDTVTIQASVEDGELTDAKVTSYSKGKGVFALRESLLAQISKSLPPNDAALVSGILLGSKKLLTNPFEQKLINSGTIHIVVASGTNVTLTAAFLLALLLPFITRDKAIVIALGGVWVYVALAGFDPPLVRAAIMGSVAFSAQAFGRLSDSLSALSVSALSMLVINPLWISDVGFQLSLMATVSLILFEQYLNSKLHFVPHVLRQDLSTTLAAQIGVAPLLMYYFDRVSIISPFVNVLVLWTVVPIMIISSIGLFISLLLPVVGVFVLSLTFIFTRYFITIVSIFG